MTMQRARRLASVVVVASLGVAGLSACRSEPSVAAYVGDSERISQDRVDAVYNDVRDKLQASPPAAMPGSPTPSGAAAVPITRADVVSLLVGSDLVSKLATDQGVPAGTDEQLQEPQLSAALGLPADSEYAQLYAKWLYTAEALVDKVQTPAEPTDAELQELQKGLVDSGQYDPSTPFAKFKTDITASQNMTTVRKVAGLRDELKKASSDANVRINPRFQPTSRLPVLVTGNQQTGQVITLMSLPIGSDDAVAPVTDAR
jgi:hypothetical protein